MSIIGHLASTLLHAALPIDLFPGNATSATSESQPSSFGQLLSELQQLRQTNPSEYKQVTQKIATNLQSAGQNELAGDFTSASATCQLPNIQDLAHAIGGRSSHHQGSGAASIIQSALTSAGIPH
jgi:hypothetical protein